MKYLSYIICLSYFWAISGSLLSGCATSKEIHGDSIHALTFENSVALSCVAKDFSLRIVWDADSQTVILGRGEVRVTVTPGSDIAMVAGEPKKMDFEAYVRDKEVYIPIPFYEKVLKPAFGEMESKAEIVENGQNPSLSYNPQIDAKKAYDLCVVLDAGHGGHDSGAPGPEGLREKELTLSVTTKVAAYLRQVGAKVILTRGSDVYLPLDKRIQIANESKAQCFVSIHLNSAPVPAASGFEIWVGQNTKEERHKQSMSLAQWIQRYMASELPLHKRGIRKSQFRVIYQTTIPAVLIECCFLTNEHDVGWIILPESQEKLARQIYLGILAYHYSQILQQKPKKSS